MKPSWVERNANVVAVLALLVAASYINSLFNPFMWDDKQLVLYNEGIRLGWTSVANAFNPNAKRLPLHAPAGEKDLFDVVEIAPWTQGE